MFRVGDEYRTNRKSVTPGGVTVCVIETGKTAMMYERVKNPHSYARAILRKKDHITKIWVLETNEVLYP